MKKTVLFLSCLVYITTAHGANNQPSQPSYQQNLSVTSNTEQIFDLNTIKPSLNELSNQELFEKRYGFEFSGLKNRLQKKSAPLGLSNTSEKLDKIDKIDFKPEWIPIILQLMNNNLEAHAQKTETAVEKLTPPAPTSKLTTILGAFGLGGSSAGGSILGGIITLGVLIIVQKYKLI